MFAVLTLVVSRFKLQSQEERKQPGKVCRGSQLHVEHFKEHNRALLKEAQISSLVKCLYTLDPEYTSEKLDQIPPSWPRFNFDPKNSPMFKQFPHVLYHSCDLAHVDYILQDGLIPGGWPKSSGRSHNYFITMPPWSANMRKLAGTRAGKPMYIAFDLELMMQHGCRVFQN